jgi:hypothetical protein
MSSDIIYHDTIVRIPAIHANTKEDMFLHMWQIGSSNCYEIGSNGRDGRRSRSWEAAAFGTEQQVLIRGIQIGGGVEGGCLKVGGFSRSSSPESYIRRVRNLLRKAKETNALLGCSFKGDSLGFSAFVREKTSDDKEIEIPYNFREPESFTAFVERFNAERGFEQMAHRYFRVYGPEMR